MRGEQYELIDVRAPPLFVIRLKRILKFKQHIFLGNIGALLMVYSR